MNRLIAAKYIALPPWGTESHVRFCASKRLLVLCALAQFVFEHVGRKERATR